MAELTHFYDEENTVGSMASSTFSNAMTVGSNPAQVLGSALTANTKYLIVARALIEQSSLSNHVRCRVQTDDDPSIEAKSEARVEVEQTASGDMLSYLFTHSFVTDASPADVEFQLAVVGGSTARIDQSSLFLLDLDAISASNILETAYFDTSDAGPTDTGADWTSDSSAFDGSTSTGATTSTGGGVLSGEGTTASTSGATIGLVQFRTYMSISGAGAIDITIAEDSVGGTELGTDEPTSEPLEWRPWVTLTAPLGGWTWQKVNDLAVSFQGVIANADIDVRRCEVRVLSSLGYVEDINPATGTEIADDGATPPADWTDLATLASADLLDSAALLETGYFDASDAGPTDTGGDWTGDANAFDGSAATEATTTAAPATLTGEGTTVSTSGDTIGEVWVHVRLGGSLPVTVTVDEDSVGGTELGTVSAAAASLTRFRLTAPGGGWTWQKVNDLAISFTTAAGTGHDVQIAEVVVYSTAVNVPYLVFGHASIGVGSTGRFFRTEIRGADVGASIATLGFHQAEGEDTVELRNNGYAIRHEATTTSTDIIIRAQEEAANGNMTDEGSYLIALPKSLFADLAYDFTLTNVSVGTTETTVASVGPFTPSVDGNHLIIGAGTHIQHTALTTLHLEDGTTETRTGDSTPTHNQNWDAAKDQEQMRTFERISISAEKTYNLRALSSASGTIIGGRWLIVVNLNPPSTATVYPPFPRRPSRRIRM